MKVALVQMDIAWESPSKNRETAERLMLSAEKSDIYVLPEMWNTGVTTEPQGVAEDENGETLQWMQRMANQLDAAICGSIAIKAKINAIFLNAFMIIYVKYFIFNILQIQNLF